MSRQSRARQQFAIIQRRKQVAELYLVGKRLREIAEIVGVDYGTVCKDMTEVRDQWKAETVVDYDTKVLEELARLQRVEEKAWEGWEKSMQDATTTTTKTKYMKEKIPGGKKDRWKLIPFEEQTDISHKGQSGNPRFLEQIERCVQLRLKLIGALDPDVTQNVNVIQVNWGDLTKRPEPSASDPLKEALAELRQANQPPTLPDNSDKGEFVLEVDDDRPDSQAVVIESTAHLEKK